MSGLEESGKRLAPSLQNAGSVEYVILARAVNKWLSFKSLPFQMGKPAEGSST